MLGNTNLILPTGYGKNEYKLPNFRIKGCNANYIKTDNLIGNLLKSNETEYINCEGIHASEDVNMIFHSEKNLVGISELIFEFKTNEICLFSVLVFNIITREWNVLYTDTTKSEFNNIKETLKINLSDKENLKFGGVKIIISNKSEKESCNFNLYKLDLIYQGKSQIRNMYENNLYKTTSESDFSPLDEKEPIINIQYSSSSVVHELSALNNSETKSGIYFVNGIAEVCVISVKHSENEILFIATKNEQPNGELKISTNGNSVTKLNFISVDLSKYKPPPPPQQLNLYQEVVHLYNTRENNYFYGVKINPGNPFYIVQFNNETYRINTSGDYIEEKTPTPSPTITPTLTPTDTPTQTPTPFYKYGCGKFPHTIENLESLHGVNLKNSTGRISFDRNLESDVHGLNFTIAYCYLESVSEANYCGTLTINLGKSLRVNHTIFNSTEVEFTDVDNVCYIANIDKIEGTDNLVIFNRKDEYTPTPFGGSLCCDSEFEKYQETDVYGIYLHNSKGRLCHTASRFIPTSQPPTIAYLYTGNTFNADSFKGKIIFNSRLDNFSAKNYNDTKILYLESDDECYYFDIKSLTHSINYIRLYTYIQ